MRKIKGFTLIELLVVVLIIGILAAIALPQYQRAVLKTRSAAVLPLLRALASAQERYFLYTDSYAGSFEDLDISLPKDAEISGERYVNDNVQCWIQTAQTPKSIYCKPAINKKTIGIAFENYFQKSVGTHQGRVYCWATLDNEIPNKICMEMSSKTTPDFVTSESNGYILFMN
jgi:type IV pilus assembly protein PilE